MLSIIYLYTVHIIEASPKPLIFVNVLIQMYLADLFVQGKLQYFIETRDRERLFILFIKKK